MSVEFFDTNILVCAHDSDMGFKQRRALELVTRLMDGSAAAISIQVLIEFYAIATRKLGMSSSEAQDILQDWTRWMTVHRPNPEDIVRAAGIQRRYRVPWFDTLILNSALELGCSVLWTEDLNRGQRYAALTACNPFA